MIRDSDGTYLRTLSMPFACFEVFQMAQDGRHSETLSTASDETMIRRHNATEVVEYELLSQ
jgi:hypothetical protein